MKREDVMQGSWSVAVDEKRPSLAVDDEVLVGTPAWWRTVAMDGVADGGGWVERVFWRPRSMNGEMEGGGGSQNLGRACLKCGKVTNLSPI